MEASVVEFTVAPFIQQGEGKSYHEWFIEFEKTPADMDLFSKQIERSYYVLKMSTIRI